MSDSQSTRSVEVDEDGKIIPRALQKGDLIAFISPSSRLNTIFPTRITQAKSYFSSLGFQTVEIFTPNLSPDSATSIRQRCEEIHTAFSNPLIKAIICTIGGLSANQLLPHLDYKLVKSNPKIFVGYSDITLLHHAFFTQANLRTFYGPAVIPQFGESPHPIPFTSDHFFSTLMHHDDCHASTANGDNDDDKTTKQLIPRSSVHIPTYLDWSHPTMSSNRISSPHARPSPPWKWLRGSKTRATGRLFGGCLPSLVQLTGTRHLPCGFYAGKILLLETPDGHAGPDTPMPVDAARAALFDLSNCGVFDGVEGVVVGRLFLYGQRQVEQFERAVLDVCSSSSFPILTNVDVGHVDPILTLSLGSLVTLDSEKDEFVVREHVVC